VAEDFLAKFGRSLRKISSKLVEIDVDGIFKEAEKPIEKAVRNILLTNLENAIAQTPEFQDEALSERLRVVFSKEDMVKVEGEKIRIYAPSKAGDYYDLARIMASAKNEYSDSKLSPEDALNFWKERIYKPARENTVPTKTDDPKRNFYRGNKFDYRGYGREAYRQAIDTRLSRTTQMPFWNWLEDGLDASYYPSWGATNFVRNTKDQGNALYREEVLKLTREVTSVINDDMAKFLENPETFEPGTIFSEIIGFTEETYYVIVTPKSKLGVTTERP